MSSASLTLWNTVRAVSLDAIEAAHGSVGGSGRGRRYATEQINHAYTVLLASQFQGFCRDLHGECVRALDGAATMPPLLATLLRTELFQRRQLDKANATRESITADFARFGFSFYNEVVASDRRNIARYRRLQTMNTWRNAIAHQDFSRLVVSGNVPALRLATVRGWRRSCDGLAKSFDRVMQAQLRDLTGVAPW